MRNALEWMLRVVLFSAVVLGTNVHALSGPKQVAAGERHSLRLGTSGTVWGSGNNAVGQLGDNTTLDRHVPVAVSGLSNIVSIATGSYHSLALRSDSVVLTWGMNTHRQVRDEVSDYRAAPVAVFAPAKDIAGGYLHSAAVRTDGTVWTWGDLRPLTQVSGLTQVVNVAAGEGFTLALRADGTVWKISADHPSTLVQAPGLTQVTSIAAGENGHVLSVLADGTVRGWGGNDCGQLGDGTTLNRPTPVQAVGPGFIVSIAAGWRHAIAQAADGRHWAWGCNDWGQLGDGTHDNGRYLPVLLPAH